MLLALVAKPRAHFVASQSTSATYMTSVVTYKLRRDTFFQHVDMAKTVPSLQKSDNPDKLEVSSAIPNDNIVELLSQMKDSFEVSLIILAWAWHVGVTLAHG